ncbi:MAG TPA: methionine--tRNA ligase [Gemmatimonadales bacterium]|nr:methionine--tRNA ligase [Gemmatimonadales bacterium]
MARFFITTAIDYANGEPHMGHAFEKIGADCIARYRRLRGDDVWFLIGMDEHGQKVARTAADLGITPAQLVDRLAATFRATWTELAISQDQFIRTTDPAHHAGVRELIERIFARNPDDFYERAYAGWYCVGCEAFKTEAEIVDGKCSLHPTRTLDWVEERNWFFRLSRYQDFLRDLHQRRPDFLQPESRRNEILGLLRHGLEDISASRSRFTWGVPFPRPTSDGEQQTTYVWFDALPNYWTASRFPGSGAHWPAQLHVIGKDITRFHTIIWPALLHAAGEAVPERVWAHGFIYFGSDRLSKSAGVRLDLGEAIARHGPDALRYFLMREVGFANDGTFTWERFDERYQADLADGLGNLASRSLAMLERYRGGTVPAGGTTPLDQAGERAVASYGTAMDALDLRAGLDAAWELVTAANQYIVQTAPWALAKRGADADLDTALAALARCLIRLAVLAGPFMPGKAQELWRNMGQPALLETAWALAAAPEVTGLGVRKTEGLFPRLAPPNP